MILRTILKDVSKITDQKNADLYFVYLPYYARYKKDQIKYFQKNDIKNKVKILIEDLNIKFIDIDKEVFQKETNPLELFPFQIYGHYTSEGYRKIAFEIYKASKWFFYKQISKNQKKLGKTHQMI